MTSKLIVNSLAADTGVSTITFADQAKMGNAIFHSTGFTIGDSFLHSTGVNITNINATGVITATKFVGEVSVGSSITFEDNEKAYFGTGTDFSIYHNGSASYLDETGTGGLIVKTDTAFQVFNSAGSQPAFTVTPGGTVDLYHNNSKKFETSSLGITVNGAALVGGNIEINQDAYLKIGASNDLNFTHTGADSYIQNVTGDLYIQSVGTNSDDIFIDAKDDISIRVQSTENAIKCIGNGAVELYHNNTKRFETFDNSPFVGVSVVHDVVLNSTGDSAYRWAVNGNASSNFKWSMFYSNSSSSLNIFDNVNSRTMASFKETGAIELNYQASKKFETTSGGVQITGNIVSDNKFETSGSVPFIFTNNGATGTFNKTVVYANYNNTSNHVYNGLLFDMGHLTDSGAGEVRKFTIGERGGPTNVTFDQNGIHFGHGSANPTLGTNTGLDDYEEGSWTPTAHGYTGSNTSGNCFYTKIGRLVVATFRITWPSLTNSTSAEIRGLPFQCISQTVYTFGGGFSETNDNDNLSMIVRSGSSSMLILRCTSSGVDTQSISEVSGKDFRGTVSYFTDS